MTKLGHLPGALLALGLFGSTPLSRRLGFWTLSKRLTNQAVMRSFIDPIRSSAAIRRDAAKVLRSLHSRYTLQAAQELPRFAGPVLLVWALDDIFFPLEDAYRLQEVLNEAEVVEVPDSRTYISEDQPEGLAASIRTFLAESERAPLRPGPPPRRERGDQRVG